MQLRQNMQKSRELSSRKPQETAERRQVYGDVLRLGRLPTALSGRMDPEDLREGYQAPIRNVSLKPCSASAGLLRSSWVTACWPTSAIRGHTNTTPNARCERGWSW